MALINGTRKTFRSLLLPIDSERFCYVLQPKRLVNSKAMENFSREQEMNNHTSPVVNELRKYTLTAETKSLIFMY